MLQGDDVKAVTIYVKYRLEDVVYLKLAASKTPGMVIGFNVRPGGTAYVISWPDGSTTDHYGCELTSEYIPDYGDDT
jgi:hypothetical protein